METTTVKSFVKEVLARFKGDDNEVVAQRNYRLANAAVKGQLSTLEGKKVKAEVNVETAKEKLDAAKYPTSLIEDGSDYIRNIVRNQESLDEAKEKLETINESIKYFQGLSTEFDS